MKITALASFICAASLALGAMAQSTTSSTAQQASTPAPTTKAATPVITPAATTKALTPVTTPASITKAPTPASTPLATNKAAANCIKVSVEGDATYCVAGPICSGGGKEPAGKNCPKKGDVAVESCLKTLKRYVDVNKCMAPVDAECRAVKTGVWGCAWPTTTIVISTPAATTKAPTPVTTPATTAKVANPVTTPTATTKLPTPATAPGATTKAPALAVTPSATSKAVTPASTPTKSPTPATTPTPTPTLRVDAASGGRSGSQDQHESHASQKVSFKADRANARDRGVGVAVGTAAAAAACAAVGVVLYKKRKSAKRQAYDAAVGTPLP